MKSFLILPHIQVENANAIAGITYGFPSITHFLGYVHALSRELEKELNLQLGGCGIVCHHYQIHAHKTEKYRESVFSLSRNPLNKEGKTPPFNEEGKMRMEISLIIECKFTSGDFDLGTDNEAGDNRKLEGFVFDLAFKKRLAGGIITSMSNVEFYESPLSNGEFSRSSLKENDSNEFSLKQLLPGFALLDRSDLFNDYLLKNPDIDALQGLLDFYTKKSKSSSSEEEKSKKWKEIPKPKKGWFVPIHIGYQAISPLYENHEVKCTRDQTTPFRFVEPLYGLGEWRGVHRIKDIRDLIWNYQTENEMYICQNKNKGVKI